MLKKILFTILIIYISTLSSNASDTNTIRNLKFKPELSNLNTNDFYIEYIGISFANILGDNPISSYYSSFHYNYVFYNSKGKKNDKYKPNFSKKFDISKLPLETVSYKAVPVYSWNFDLETLIRNNAQLMVLTISEAWELGKAISGEFTKFDDIVENYFKERICIKEEINKYHFVLNNNTSILFEKYRDVCQDSSTKVQNAYYNNACGAIIIDTNGEHLPNKLYANSELNDRFKLYIYSDIIDFPYGDAYKFIVKNSSPQSISPELLRDYYTGTRSYFKNLTIEYTLPMLDIKSYNKANKIHETNIEIRFYDNQDKLIATRNEEIQIGHEVFDMSERENNIPLDFNTIPQNAVAFSLNIVTKE